MAIYLYSSLFSQVLAYICCEKLSTGSRRCFVKIETENKQSKSEIDTLKRGNAEIRETNKRLKQSREKSEVGLLDHNELFRLFVVVVNRTRLTLKPPNSQPSQQVKTLDNSTDSKV